MLSGGGADGAYEVGVAKALLSGKSPASGHLPVTPQIFSGTSIGAFNAAFLVGEWDRYGTASASNLEWTWLDRLADRKDGRGNGFMRLRVDPFRVFDPRLYLREPWRGLTSLATDATALTWDGIHRLAHLLTAHEEPVSQRFLELVDFGSLFSMEPWSRTTRETIDYGAIRISSRRLRLAATNWATGQLKIFENRDMTDSNGPLVIQGSSGLPGFVPPTQLGAELYVDGGVLMNTPLKPAIAAGADVLYTVYLDPDVRAIPLSHIANTFAALYRMIQIKWASAFNDDIEDAEAVNRGLIPEVGRDRDRSHGKRRALVSDRSEGEGAGRYRPLTIHRFHPREDLGGELGILNLRRKRIEALIERGFDDAASHDCAAAGCVLPELGRGAAGDSASSPVESKA